MTHTLRDELMKLYEFCDLATPGTRHVRNDNEGTQYGPLWVIENDAYLSDDDETPDPLAIRIDFGCLADARLMAACSPERIKALAEVAMAGEYFADCQNRVYRGVPSGDLEEAWVALQVALERLGKAVGT